VKSRIRLDSTDLDKGSAKAAKFGADVQTHMDKGTTHTLRLKESMTTLVEHMDRLPPVVGSSARSIESMVSSMGAGASAAGVFGTVAVAALGAAVAVAAEGVKGYVDLGEKVENYRRVTGASAEESSRVVETFDRLGVSSDSAASAIFMLSKRIEASPKKLHDLGVEIAYTEKGTVDLNATLLNIADAYTKTDSATDKNAIAVAAFGRGSRELIPVLEQGREGLARLEAQAKMIYTEQDLQRIRDYKIAQKETDQAWQSYADHIGQAVLGPYKDLLDNMNSQIYVQDQLSDSVKRSAAEHRFHTTNVRQLAYELGREYLASLGAQNAIDHLTESMRQAQTEADNEATALDNLVQATESQYSASLALERANLNLTKSQNAITDAQAALTKATADYGPGSRQAADAQVALSESLVSQKEAYLADAVATQKVAEDQAKMSGDTLTAADSARIYRDRLQELAAGLAVGSPLRTSLQGYIDELNNHVPKNLNTDITITSPASSRALLAMLNAELHDISSQAQSVGVPVMASGRAFASGGRPPVGLASVIGERGPELWVPDRPGTVVPASQTADVLSGGDMSETNDLLRENNELLRALAAPPSGQTGVEAALYKAVGGAVFNRARGMAGA